MSEDMKLKVQSAVSDGMALIFGSAGKEYKWANEANALMQKWVDDHGSFGVDGVVEALLWWQDEASDENPYPLTQKDVSHGRT